MSCCVCVWVCVGVQVRGGVVGAWLIWVGGLLIVV